MYLFAGQEDHIALAIFLLACLSYMSSSHWCKHIPVMFYRKRVLKEKEIAALKASATPHNTTDSFHLYAKCQRNIQNCEKELAEINRNYRKRGLAYNLGPWVVYYLVRFGYVLPATMLWREVEVVMIPGYLLAPVRTTLSLLFPTGDAEWFPSLGVLSWVVVCHTAVGFFVRCCSK